MGCKSIRTEKFNNKPVTPSLKMIRNVCLLAFLFPITFVQPATAQGPQMDKTQNWAAFRGDGTSLSSAQHLPTTWSDEKNIAWSAELPGYGQSSPVIWGDRVFVTTMQGEMKNVPTVICVGLDDGKVVWKKEFKATQEIKASDYVTRSSPTPALDEQHCFAFFESGELIATDHDGNIKWERSLVKEYGEFKGNHGIGSSIAVNDSSVFVLVAHEGPSYLLAVDKSTGENIWKTDLEEKVSWSSPVVSGGQVILSVSGSVQSFDSATGKLVWSVGDVKGNTVASATVHEDVAFIGSSERSQNFAVRFDATGKTDEADIIWRSDEATSSFGSPLYTDGQVFYVNKQGAVYSLDAATGETKWSQRLSGSCWASPIGVGGMVYFFTKDGPTDVLSMDTELKIVETNSLTVKDRIYGVAVADSRFVVRTGTQLICLAEGNTARVVEATDESKVEPAIAIKDCPVGVTSFGAAVCDGYLYVYGGNEGESHSYSAEGQNNVFRRVKLESGSEWESLGEVPRRQGNALVAHGGKLYRIGGFEALNELVEDGEDIVSTADFACYDPRTGEWTALVSLPEPRSSFDAVVAGDILYVVGGWALGGARNDSKWHGTAWQMDLSQETLEWKPMPAPPHERRANSLAELDGKVYLIGGMGVDARPSTSVFVFDTETQKWTDGPALPGIPMDGFGSSAFNTGGHVVVATFSGQVVELSKDGKSWENIHNLETGRFFHRLVALNEDSFAILGGTSPKSTKQTSVLVLKR